MKSKTLAVLATLGLVAGTLVSPQPAQAAAHKIFVGITLNDAALTAGEDSKLTDNAITRVFPDGDGTIPPVSDPVTQYALAEGMTRIALSTKIQAKFVDDGHGTWNQGMADTKTRLQEYVTAGFTEVYYTEHHEPEADLSSSTYKTNYTKAGGVFPTVNSLSGTYRPFVKVGHALTRQWVDNTAGRTWKTYDTGLGDFFAGDMYMNSWYGGANVATSYEAASTFLASFGAYRFDGLSAALTTDNRDRMFFELGSIGLPADTNGNGRNLWLQSVHQAVNQWDLASKGWNFIGWIWWGVDGTPGTALAGSPGIGTKRFFQLDVRHTGGIPSSNGFQTFAAGTGSAIDRFNQISAYNNS